MGNTINYQIVVDIVTKEGYDQWKKNIKDINDGTKRTKQITSELRTNLLSAMFAGMAMARLFGGQIDRVAELVGMKDMLKAFFTEALIQPMSYLSTKLVELFKSFEALDPDTKKLLGWSMILVTLIGTVIGFSAAIGLASYGLKGLLPLFSKLGAILAVIGFGSITAGIIIVIGLIVLLYYLF